MYHLRVISKEYFIDVPAPLEKAASHSQSVSARPPNALKPTGLANHYQKLASRTDRETLLAPGLPE